MEPAAFLAWANAAKGTAIVRRAEGDPYGAQLAERRETVYRQAADLLAECDEVDAAVELIRRAGVAAVLTPPLRDFDVAGLRYISARAYQFCAQTLYPDAPTVQAEWD